MEIQSPKQVMQEYFSAIAAKDVDYFVSLLDEDIVWHQPGESRVSGKIVGLKPLLAHFERMTGLSKSSFHFTEVGEVGLSGSLAVIPLRFAANHNKGRLDMPGVDVMRIKNGKIVEVWLISEDQLVEDAFWDSSE